MSHHFPAPPPSMISPQKTKSPCFQPRFLNSGLDLRRPLLLQRAELPGTCFRSNLSAARRTANRCLIILIIDTERLVRDRQLTRIHPAKGKRKLHGGHWKPATTTSTRPVSPKRFQPRFLNSGLDLRRPLVLQRAELPDTCFRSNLSAASGTANRCLIRMRSKCTTSMSAAHPGPARLLGRSWHARAIAGRLCSPAWPPVFGSETPAETSTSRVHRISSNISETMK